MADPYNQGYADGLRKAAQMLDVSASAIRLAAGEMTPQEMRTIKAVLAWRSRVILSMPILKEPQNDTSENGDNF